jgi:hypothetical protein
LARRRLAGRCRVCGSWGVEIGSRDWTVDHRGAFRDDE